MESENEDYEFEERAAIREFEGDQPRGTAEFFAREEIMARTAQQGCLTYRQQYEEEQKQIEADRKIAREANEQRKIQQTKYRQPEKQEIQLLMDQREKIGKQMFSEIDEHKKKELFAKWLDLCKQIIELRKGA